MPGGGPGHPSLLTGGVGGDPTDGPHRGEFSPQVDKKSVRDATTETYICYMIIYLDRRCPTGGGSG